jgi:hypothetical protein
VHGVELRVEKQLPKAVAREPVRSMKASSDGRWGW